MCAASLAQSFGSDHKYGAWLKESGGKPPPWQQDYAALRATCSAAAAALLKGPKENYGRIEDGEWSTEVYGWDDWWEVEAGVSWDDSWRVREMMSGDA